jgi:hypothetical protein
VSDCSQREEHDTDGFSHHIIVAVIQCRNQMG